MPSTDRLLWASSNILPWQSLIIYVRPRASTRLKNKTHLIINGYLHKIWDLQKFRTILILSSRRLSEQVTGYSEVPEKSPQKILKEKTQLSFPRQAWEYSWHWMKKQNNPPTHEQYWNVRVLWRENSLEGSSFCYSSQIVPCNRFSGCTKIILGENWKSAKPSFKTGFTFWDMHAWVQFVLTEHQD